MSWHDDDQEPEVDIVIDDPRSHQQWVNERITEATQAQKQQIQRLQQIIAERDVDDALGRVQAVLQRHTLAAAEITSHPEFEAECRSAGHSLARMLDRVSERGGSFLGAVGCWLVILLATATSAGAPRQ